MKSVNNPKGFNDSFINLLNTEADKNTQIVIGQLKFPTFFLDSIWLRY